MHADTAHSFTRETIKRLYGFIATMVILASTWAVPIITEPTPIDTYSWQVTCKAQYQYVQTFYLSQANASYIIAMKLVYNKISAWIKIMVSQTISVTQQTVWMLLCTTLGYSVLSKPSRFKCSGGRQFHNYMNKKTIEHDLWHYDHTACISSQHCKHCVYQSSFLILCKCTKPHWHVLLCCYANIHAECFIQANLDHPITKQPTVI